MKKVFAVALLCLPAAGALPAAGEREDPGPPGLRPREAVEAALAAHPRLSAARERVAQVREQRRQALGGARPQVKAEINTVRTRDPGLLNSPNFEQLSQTPGFDPGFLRPIPVTTYAYGLNVEQVLYAFGKVAVGVRALAQVERQIQEETEAVRLEVSRDVLLALLDLALADRRLEVLAAERAARERQVRQAEDFLEIGAGTRLQLLQARAALAGLVPRERAAEGDRARARARLNETLGRGPLAPVAAHPDLLDVTRPLPPAPSDESTLAELVRRPDLEAIRVSREVLALQRRVTRTDLLPEVKFSGSYGIRTIRTENLFDSEFSSWDAGIYFEWSLYDGGTTRARLRELERRRAEAVHQERALELQLGRELISALSRYTQAREAIQAAKAAVEEAQEAERVAVDSFQLGAATVLDLLEAERTLTESRFQLLEAVHDALSARVELDVLRGRAPEEFLETRTEKP